MSKIIKYLEIEPGDRNEKQEIKMGDVECGYCRGAQRFVVYPPLPGRDYEPCRFCDGTGVVEAVVTIKYNKIKR